MNERACVNYVLRNICQQLPWRTRPLLPVAENKETNASMSEQPRPVHRSVFPPSVSQVDGTHCHDALHDTLGACNQSPSLCTQHLHVTTTGEPPLFHQPFRAALQ